MAFSFSNIPWKRFAVYWILTYLVWSGASLLFFTFFIVAPNPFILLLLQIFPPLWLLLMGWLYFRKANATEWGTRIFTSILWVVLAVIASIMLMKPIYGVSGTSLLTRAFFIGQGINTIALLVGGFAASKKSGFTKPEGLAE